MADEIVTEHSPQDIGIRLIRLGAALLDPDSQTSKLAELAFDCGFQLEFKLTKNPTAAKTPAPPEKCPSRGCIYVDGHGGKCSPGGETFAGSAPLKDQP